MSVYRVASHAFESINVTGRLNAKWMDSDVAACSAAAGMRALQRRVQARHAGPAVEGWSRPVVLAARAVEDGSVYLARSAQFAFAGGLYLHRWLPLPILLAPVCWGLVPYAPAFLEAVFGRGCPREHSQYFQQAPDPDEYRQHMLRSHYGFVGELLEKEPLNAARRAYFRGADTAAASCMLAAVVGRAVLQPIRFVVFVCSFAYMSVATAAIMVLCAAFEVGVRAVQLVLQGCSQTTGWPLQAARSGVASAVDACVYARHGFAHVYPPSPPAATMTVDDGSPGATDRVWRRAVGLLSNFARVVPVNEEIVAASEQQQLRQVRMIANAIADNLRDYCQNLPTQEALRGGLSQVKAFIEATYDGDAVGFDPPELAEVVRQAA